MELVEVLKKFMEYESLGVFNIDFWKSIKVWVYSIRILKNLYGVHQSLGVFNYDFLKWIEVLGYSKYHSYIWIWKIMETYGLSSVKYNYQSP